MAEVSLEMDTVQVRAARLDMLEAHLEKMSALVSGVRDQQGTARWTSVPECQAFAQAYAGSLAELERHLKRLRRQVLGLRLDLEASARALVRTDEEAQALMQRVNSRFGGSDPTPGAPSAPAAPGGTDAPASPFAPSTADAPASPLAPGA